MRRCGKRYSSEDEALHSKRGLTGLYEAVRCRSGCWGVHLKKRQPQKDTGPSRKVRALVLERDGYRCARCGKPCGPGIAAYSLQHRVPRGSGGTSDPAANSPCRLVLLCGTATTECHGAVENHDDPADNAKGYRLKMGQDPALEPVQYFERMDGPGFTAWLCEDGSLLFEAPAAAGDAA